MPKTTPRQAVQQISIKSATIRQSETNRTNGDWAIQKSRPVRRKMSENDENLFPWQRLLRDNGKRPNFAWIIYAGRPSSWRKNGEGWSRTFWTNPTRTSSTNRKQFWLSESPEDITDGATEQKTKFPTFSFPATMCLSRVVLELRRKKRNFRKRKLVAMATSRENSKFEVQIVHLQP